MCPFPTPRINSKRRRQEQFGVISFVGGSVRDCALFGKMTPLYLERLRQKRICRSAQAAEVRALYDVLELGRLLQLAIEEVLFGPIAAQKAPHFTTLRGSACNQSQHFNFLTFEM